MRSKAQCIRCKLLLDVDEFYVNVSAGRLRMKECKVCRHQRLAKEHNHAVDKLLAIRRRRRDEQEARIHDARAVAGKD